MQQIVDFLEIQRAVTKQQIASCYEVMRQLRPHLASVEEFVEQFARQIENGYCLIYIEQDNQVKVLAGFRTLEFFAWDKFVYIDDLVCDAACRKNGFASKLLHWIIKDAKKSGCKQVHLDSGPLRHDARRLYLNHGFKILAHHFSLDLVDSQ